MTWAKAREVHGTIRSAWRTPDRLHRADAADLEATLRPLGLQRRRSILLVRLATAWVVSPPRMSDDVAGLPGCGRYAADSWAMFVEGRRVDDPSDHKLAWHAENRMPHE